MTVEVLPVGQTCNLMCPYCYEHPLRDAGNYGPQEYDMDKMKEALAKELGSYTNLTSGFTIFGGEPLLMQIDDLEELIRWGNERFEKNMKPGYSVVSIQTNGVLITDRHREIFKKYNVTLGISVDGPEECNDSRWAGSLERTRERTQKSMDNIASCVRDNISVGLIITIWRGNAARDRRSKFKNWIKEMHTLGVKGARLHMLEVDHNTIASEWELTTKEYLEFLMDLHRFGNNLSGWKFDMFEDSRQMLQGNDKMASCIYLSCDPYTTAAVGGVDGQGTRVNCGRADHTGVDWQKADQVGYERYLGLYNTSFEDGGCGGCRFFLMCKGNCQGTAEKGDWRHRTSNCESLMGIYEMLEGELLEQGIEPLSMAPHRRAVEQFMLNEWDNKRNPSLSYSVAQVVNGCGQSTNIVDGHIVHHDGDVVETHGDSPHGDSDNSQNIPHGDSEHGDIAHGDSSVHGDAAHGDAPHGDSDLIK